jgi:predicted ATPase
VLHDALRDASAGHPQVVIVEGEAGIGKTTLVERFLSDLPAPRLLKASGDESELHVPFAMADHSCVPKGAPVTPWAPDCTSRWVSSCSS